MESQRLYDEVKEKSRQIREELQNIGRWDLRSPTQEQLTSMGAFGANSISFEQWLRYVLLERIKSTIAGYGDFPDSSMVGTYAIRYYDGDPESDRLQGLLYELDSLINNKSQPAIATRPENRESKPELVKTVVFGTHEIPNVVFQVFETLPLFKGEDLESQLQTIDTFLQIMSPDTHGHIIKLLEVAFTRHKEQAGKERLQSAIDSLRRGQPLAAPYDHDEAMRKYREEHRKNFPDAEF